MDLVPITAADEEPRHHLCDQGRRFKGVVNILGKVTTLTHKTVQTFEDTVEVEQPAELLEKALDRKSVYWKALPLVPGLYRLDIAIKDVNNPDHVGYYGRGIECADLSRRKAGHFVADPGRSDEHCLVAGDRQRQLHHRQHLYPAACERQRRPTPVSFKRTQHLNFWMQVYNLGIDEATKSNQATVTYQITDTHSRTQWFLKSSWNQRNWERTATS